MVCRSIMSWSIAHRPAFAGFVWTAALLGVLAEQSISDLATLADQGDRGVRGEPHLAWVHVVTPREHEPIEPIEDRRQVGLANERGNEDGQGIGGEQALEIAAVNKAVGRPALGRGPEVGVDADQWTILHDIPSMKWSWRNPFVVIPGYAPERRPGAAAKRPELELGGRGFPPSCAPGAGLPVNPPCE